MRKENRLIYLKVLAAWLILSVLMVMAGCSSDAKRAEPTNPERWPVIEESEVTSAQKREEEVGTEAPVFTGTEDLYAVRGQRIDYLKTIRAFDAKGVELTAQIRVDASRVISDECGEYEVRFTVEDEDGRVAETACRVHIVEGEEAVVLYLKEYEPAFVRIRSKAEESTVWGSGFLLAIEEEYLYVMTNAHVALEKEVEVFFYEGSQATGQVLGRKKEPDMAVIRISRGETEGDLPADLAVVDADLSHWESLDPRSLPAIGYRCKDKEENLWIEKTGVLLGKEESIWALDYPVLSYTAENIPGASGAAVLDESGKLIAMALGISEEAEETAFWGIRLPDILDYYEEIRQRTGSPAF